MKNFKVINDPEQRVPIKVWSDLEKVEAKAKIVATLKQFMCIKG